MGKMFRTSHLKRVRCQLEVYNGYDVQNQSLEESEVSVGGL